MRSTVLWFFHRVSALRVLFSILTAVSLLPHICSVQLFISYYSLSPGAACIYKSCSSQPTPAVSLFVACFYTFDSWHAVHHGKLLSLLNDSRGSTDVLSGEHTSSTPSAPSALPHISFSLTSPAGRNWDVRKGHEFGKRGPVHYLSCLILWGSLGGGGCPSWHWARGEVPLLAVMLVEFEKLSKPSRAAGRENDW